MIEDLAEQFNRITKALRDSGKDLGRIKISMEHGRTPSYITRRIIKELEGGEAWKQKQKEER